MELNKLKDEIQNKALEEWRKNNKVGTCEIITGLGKTFLFLKALCTYPKFENDTHHLFLAEQIDRKLDLNKDIDKFNKVFNRDIYAEYNLSFGTYQTVRNWAGHTIGLVGADEIHDSMSRENCKFFINNDYDGIIGLTAKFDGTQQYDLTNHLFLQKEFGKLFVTKQKMLDHIAPIIFTYNIAQGQKEGTSRKLNVFIIEHFLNSVDKNVKAGSVKNTFYQTEQAYYFYLTKIYESAVNLEPKNGEDLINFSNKKNLGILSAINKRKKFLHSLPSKRHLCQTLLDNLIGKTIVFGNDIEELSKITPNVVSSKKTNEENESIRDLFDKNIINVIASFKKLKQGANLEEVDNCINHSYYGIEIDWIQRIGRLRQNMNKDGNVFILVSKNTQEEAWLNNMLGDASGLNVLRMSMDKFITEKHYESCNK